jgi:hypothetical protein|nr:MAG TPA: hypothetical protein [Inoviridae sp.]
MNGVVKRLFMFVFGFIAAFSFMFFVNGTLKPSNDGIIEYVKKPYASPEVLQVNGITFNTKGMKDGVVGIQGTPINNQNMLFQMSAANLNTEEIKNTEITAFLRWNTSPVKDVSVGIYTEFNLNGVYGGYILEPVYPEIYVQKNLYDIIQKNYPEKVTEEAEITVNNLLLLVGNNSVGKYFDLVVNISVKGKTEVEAQNMLTWFTNVVNTTRQQSFWDFVKEPIQRFIDKMSYFDSLEKPSFVEVLTAIWNVFLLILSPIEITGRALWWLALVLYDLIPLLLNPTWV